ncbi:MAG: hypothetical protein JEY96_06305 [Bacteroidales bacterium]|nr:hypothetical protein [Bacteroidales bacterium]
MRKLLIIIGVLFLFIQNSFSQEISNKVDINLGAEQKESKKITLSDIAGYDETGFYAVKRKRNAFGFVSSITLEHFDNKQNFTKSVELDLKYQKKDMYYRFIIHINDELFLFSSFKNQKLKQNFLFIQSIDKNTLELKQGLKKIAQIDYSGKGRRNAGNFNYRLSRDSSKVLIYYDLPYDKGSKEKFGFHVFDKNLNQLWEKKVTLPYNDELFDIKNYKVDNLGNVHLLGRIIPERVKGDLYGKLKYKHQILSYLNNGNDLKEYLVEIEGKFLSEMQIELNDDQDIMCGGFYSDTYTKVHSDVGYKIGSDAATGTYFIKIDGNSKEIINKNFKEFGVDFITQNMSEKQKKKTEKKIEKGKKNADIRRYDLKDFIIREDGRAFLIGEQYYVNISEQYYTDSKGDRKSKKVYTYYYNDIIVINISPEGKIEWATKIPKRQRTVDDGGFYSSYAHSVVNDKLYFVFNDNPENLSYDGVGTPAIFTKGRNSIVVLVELNSKGDYTRETLFSTKDEEIFTRPKVCEQISEKEMILYGQKKRTHRFAKITFKD